MYGYKRNYQVRRCSLVSQLFKRGQWTKSRHIWSYLLSQLGINT